MCHLRKVTKSNIRFLLDVGSTTDRKDPELDSSTSSPFRRREVVFGMVRCISTNVVDTPPPESLFRYDFCFNFL